MLETLDACYHTTPLLPLVSKYSSILLLDKAHMMPKAKGQDLGRVCAPGKWDNQYNSIPQVHGCRWINPVAAWLGPQLSHVVYKKKGFQSVVRIPTVPTFSGWSKLLSCFGFVNVFFDVILILDLHFMAIVPLLVTCIVNSIVMN